MSQLECRFCFTPLHRTFVDLGMSPLANSYLEPEQLTQPEPFYPLRTWVCDWCHLVQLPEIASPEAIFRDHAELASDSEARLEHVARYAEAMIGRFGLTAASRVIEVASNDGYLLRFFKEREVPVLGIEPARNAAAAAEKIGIPTRGEFFGEELAHRLVEEGIRADLLVGNHVLAQTPHLNEFVAGLKIVLAPGGVITLEFPHLQPLIEHNQFDAISHEHFCYFSFTVVRRVLGSHGLAVFDVEELTTHGGSLRVFAGHAGDDERPVTERVDELLSREERLGYSTEEPYRWFGERVKATKRRLLYFLMRVKDTGRRIAGYGTPARGNTLLNYCGIRTDFLDYTVDATAHKQGLYLPGTRIPIHSPDHLRENRPDYVLILPWNRKDEIMEQLSEVREWGGQFVVALPEVKVFE